MPHPLELPGMLCAVVPLMCGERRGGAVVREFVALTFGPTAGIGRRLTRRRPGLVPGFAAVVGALDHLAEPAAGLRGVDAVGIFRRALEVIDLPPSEVRARNLPVLAFAVSSKDECAFSGTD